MKLSFFKLITYSIPKSQLPSLHRSVVNVQTGEQKRIELSIKEKRENVENRLKNKWNQILDKYSPIRRASSYLQAKRLKEKKRLYHELIGEITVTHAGIEQNLKAALACDWGIKGKIKTARNKKKKIKHLYGEELLDTFSEKLKEMGCPDQWCLKYSQILNVLKKASQKRNQFVKALYGHNEDTQEIIQIDQLAHNNMRQILQQNNNDFEHFKNQWLKPVHASDLKKLLHELKNIAKSLQELRSKIFLEKHKLHWKIFIDHKVPVVPEDAYKNPYKYKNLLPNKNE